jgi:hypothetical protein
VAPEAFVLGLGKHIAAGSAGYGSAAASPPGAGAAADRHTTTICPVPDCRSPFQTAFDVRAGMIVPSAAN